MKDHVDYREDETAVAEPPRAAPFVAAKPAHGVEAAKFGGAQVRTCVGHAERPRSARCLLHTERDDTAALHTKQRIGNQIAYGLGEKRRVALNQDAGLEPALLERDALALDRRFEVPRSHLSGR